MKALIVLVLLTLPIFAEDLTVTIRYGNGMPDKVAYTTYVSGISALDALKQVSTVRTSKTGKYLFVRSIDGVKSKVGKFGWFYTVDDKPVHTTAENTVLTDAKSMTWVYKVEACY
jgi:hypothetical protein